MCFVTHFSGSFCPARNSGCNFVLRWAGKPILREINMRRLRHRLPRLADITGKIASLAQIAQQPAFFDYPRERLPDSFHYTGPWHGGDSGDAVEFPWHKLDGRPLIYASMGTLQNRQGSIFETIAAACAELDAQLVLSLGGRNREHETGESPGFGRQQQPLSDFASCARAASGQPYSGVDPAPPRTGRASTQ